MAWKIDRDYLYKPGDSIPSRVGTSQGELQGDTFTFRLRDDDDEIYYHGIADAASTEGDDKNGGLYSALKWAESDSGCTDLQVPVNDALKHGLTSQYHVDCNDLDEDDWVSIYG